MLKEKSQEIEVLKEQVTSLTADNKIIQKGMFLFIICNSVHLLIMHNM